MDVTSIALSGLAAAERRVGVSANNIANANTAGFKAQEVQQTALSAGGVRADVVERSPASVEVPAANGNGTEKVPNVSLEREVVDSITASYDFKANLKVLQVQKSLDKALLDIQA